MSTNQLIAVLLITFIGIISIIFLAVGDIRHDGMRVMETDDMDHDLWESEVGIIEQGENIYYDFVDDKDDLITYYEGRESGYEQFGSYGDVIIYYPNGDESQTPLVRRVVAWMEVNESEIVELPEMTFINYSYDVPELGFYGESGYIILENFIYYNNTVWFDIGWLIPPEAYMSNTLNLYDGFLTAADNGTNIDQHTMNLVKPEWILGKITKVNDKT